VAAPVVPDAPDELARFDATERAVHWTTAALVLVLLATGAALYAGPVSTLVGRRVLMKTVHVLAGFALPVPILIGMALPRRGRALRSDASRVNRFDAQDRRWLRRRTHSQARSGKFNAGQKLNASFLVAAGIVLFATGVMLRWPDRWAVDLRTGATFVHDWFAIGVALAVTGHIAFALRDPESRRGMVGGAVSSRWARREHPGWYEEMTGRPADRLAREKPPGRARSPR
jgi:formate dehydrogenase subunit gamma